MMPLNKSFVLGSASPRRKELLASLGLSFRCVVADIDENAEMGCVYHDIPMRLAEKKAEHLRDALAVHEVLITADTLVFLDGEQLGKPRDAQEALTFLHALSGKAHEVVTGYCVMAHNKMASNAVVTNVLFDTLQDEEIQYYVEHFKPYDKAGAYGIQEWIGKVGIRSIQGCYYNVMGLPLNALWNTLKSV